MNLLQQRIARLRSDDDGSALAIALVFLMLFGGYVGTVLHLATAGQRATLAIRDEAVDTYAGGGALDGAINAVGPAPTTGVDPGTTPIPASTCFTLPTGAMDNPTPVTVTCQPRSGSGVRPQTSANQPVQAVLAMSAHASEGVALTGTANVTVQGAVAATKRIVAPLGTRLTSTGVISASDCTLAAGTSPACTTAAAPSPPLLPEPTAYPRVVTALPACTSPLVTLEPGTYLSLAALQAVLNCTNTVVWFKPGLYYFDFRDAASSHELVIGSGDVVVGGAAAGWTPGTTAATSVPFPTAAAPTASACDTTLPGVELVFGADSRLNVTSGRAQFCAREVTTTNQRVVLRGLAAPTPALPVSAVSSGKATLASGTGWTAPASGAVVDNAPASRVVTANRTPVTSVPLRIGPMTLPFVPAEATGITLTIKVTETLSGPAGSATGVVVRPGDGTTVLASQVLRECLTVCPDSAFVSGKTDTITVTGLTAAKVNGLSLDVTVTAPANGSTTAWIDGAEISADFSAPMRATSGTGVTAPYVSGSVATTALLRVSGAASTTVLALHGTAYAPSAVIDVAVSGVSHPLMDRGVIVRHLELSSTPATGYTGPLVSVPEVPLSPRRVLFVSRNGAGLVLATADVIFADAAGTVNGAVARVQEWYIG